MAITAVQPTVLQEQQLHPSHQRRNGIIVLHVTVAVNVSIAMELGKIHILEMENAMLVPEQEQEGAQGAMAKADGIYKTHHQ